MDKSIMPECYADTLLIETLVPTQSGYNHKHSCFKVESSMRVLNAFAVGIIDNDKKQIRYLEEFEEVDKVDEELILLRHKDENKHHYIIQICPALEKWILNICETEKIDLKEFDFTNDLDELKKITKSLSSLKNENLKNLYKEISKKNENKSVRKLKGWLKALKEKNYKVGINDLKHV